MGRGTASLHVHKEVRVQYTCMLETHAFKRVPALLTPKGIRHFSAQKDTRHKNQRVGREHDPNQGKAFFPKSQRKEI